MSTAPSNLKELVEQALREANVLSDGDGVEVGAALQSITSVPARRIHQGLWDRINEVLFSQTILNALSMTEDQLDELAGNLLVTRDLGGKSTGTVRLFFSQPQAFSVPTGAAFETDTGLRFFVVSTVSITEQSMRRNIQGNRYYLDVPLVEAESEGDNYNVDPGEISRFSGSGAEVVEVRNLTQFENGRPKETNEDFLIRIREAVTVRDLVIKRSIFTVLNQNFPEITSLDSFGYGDEETILDQRFGVHSGGEVSICLDSLRAETFESVLTAFSEDFELNATVNDNPVVGQMAFVRKSPVLEPSIRHESTYTFSGIPSAIDLGTPDVGAPALPSVLDTLDMTKPIRLFQEVDAEDQTFVDDSFTVDHPGRRLTNFELKSFDETVTYYCGLDYLIDPGTGVVTKLRDSVPDAVKVFYTWDAIFGVDYDVAEDGTVTSVGAGSFLGDSDVVKVTFSYFRVGRRDDALYTITGTPMRRVMKVERLDPDDNIISELTFVPPNEGEWDYQTIADSAPASDPWWTWKVIPFQDPQPGVQDKEHLEDFANVYEHFKGISAVPGFSAGEIVAWPPSSGLRYSVFEEMQLVFADPDTNLDGTARIRVTYETLSTVPVIQDYASQDDVRVLCARLLAKTFVPVVVDISLFGVEGDATQVQEAVENYIRDLKPGNELRATEIVKVVTDADLGGATRVNTPFTMQGRVYFPGGGTESVVNTTVINLVDELEKVKADYAVSEYVSNDNTKFLPGTITVRLAQ